MSTDEILDTYDKYHAADEIKAMSVIEYEIKRNEDLMKTMGSDSEMVAALEDRIDCLKFTQESLTSDF